MALLISDSFSLYSDSTGGTKIKGWSTAFGTPNYLQTGRWGAGSYSLAPSSTSTTMSQTFTVSGNTTILGFAFSTSSTGARIITSITVNSVVVVLETVTATGGYNLRIRNTTTSTTYFTSSTIYATSTYYYFELKIIWNTGGTGQIVLRVDNSIAYDSDATLSIATANGSATLTLGATSSTGTTGNFADLLFMDGSGATFNNFQGDVRIETLSPISDGANTGWSVPNNTLLTDVNQARITTSANGWATLTGSPTLTRVATGGPESAKFPSYLNISSTTASFSIISNPNGTSGYPVTPGQTLGITMWGACSSGAPTFTTSMRFYDSSGAQVGGDLSFGSLSLGANTWALRNPTTNSVVVPATAATCAIILSFTSNGSSYRFTGFVLSTDTTTPAYTDPTGAHYINVNDAIYDSDATYVKTATLNAKETYAMSDMAASGPILGVRPIVVARKETAGPQRSIATVVRIGSTDYTGSNQVVPSTLAYTAFNDFRIVNPASNAPWTKTEVNNIEAGYSITE